MKLTYHCHDCGLQAECIPPNDPDRPRGWAYIEGADGKWFWYCSDCAKAYLPENKKEATEK